MIEGVVTFHLSADPVTAQTLVFSVSAKIPNRRIFVGSRVPLAPLREDSRIGHHSGCSKTSSQVNNAEVNRHDNEWMSISPKKTKHHGYCLHDNEAFFETVPHRPSFSVVLQESPGLGLGSAGKSRLDVKNLHFHARSSRSKRSDATY